MNGPCPWNNLKMIYTEGSVFLSNSCAYPGIIVFECCAEKSVVWQYLLSTCQQGVQRCSSDLDAPRKHPSLKISVQPTCFTVPLGYDLQFIPFLCSPLSL